MSEAVLPQRVRMCECTSECVSECVGTYDGYYWKETSFIFPSLNFSLMKKVRHGYAILEINIVTSWSDISKIF